MAALPAAPVPPDAALDPLQAARAAGLRYVTDTSPGITRRRAGRHFRFIGTDGQSIRDAETLARIRVLAIPPAWAEVWICPSPLGHIQATGRDAKGRKQYRYHGRWTVVRDETKYGRMLAFGEALPGIRARVEADLARPGLPREKVLATVVRLLETTFIRVGNAEYARHNESFGLTTMRDQHARLSPNGLRFRFRGKAGKQHTVAVDDRRLARIVKRCQELPGQELFQYIDDAGQPHPIDSADVNEYLREIAGHEFSAKDFRTWAGTVLTAWALEELEAFDSQTEAKRNIVRAIETVAERLGNTPSICRKCYVHPEVLDAYLDGSLVDQLRARVEVEMGTTLARLKPDEAAVMVLLQRRLALVEDEAPSAPGGARRTRRAGTRRRPAA
jgi:DNA topoisomerase-1